uniref:C-type lectin domain-containing protein n=1 Tax=Panagrolaimus davidi TaxID=227884 RepID=A0A914PWS1_9BILA
MLLFFSFSSLIFVVNSVCTRDKPRKEGFLRSTCIPGFYEGSCLLILEKRTLHNATETCKYDYGGRLATAPTKDAIQIWIRTIYFNTKYNFDSDTRFWIGYGYDHQNELGFIYEKPNEIMENYIGKSMWNRVFGEPEKSAPVQWENGADKNSLENSGCQNHGVVFNHKTAKFDVKYFAEEHYSLCETPRWAKLQCDREWHLVPQLRMCLKVHEQAASFLKAHSTCNSEGSFIATAQNGNELAMLRNIIVPYNLPYKIYSREKGFWAGLKTFGSVTFSMDGTEPIFIARVTDPNKKWCAASGNKNFCLHGEPCNKRSVGLVKPCYATRHSQLEYNPLPYMCQKFADSSKVKNI